jgi:penicillin-binding protein 1B
MALSRRARITLRWSAVLAGLTASSLALLLLYGWQLVEAALREPERSRSCRVFAAPLHLSAGDPWDPDELRESLLRRGIPLGMEESPPQGEFSANARGVWLGLGVTEGEEGAVGAFPSQFGLQLVAANGSRLPDVRIRRALIGTTAPADIVRWPVPLDAMAPALLTAVVDIEDRGFLDHPGLSLRGMLRAGFQDLVAGAVRQGGSTITQQLAKILLLKPARTVPRKLFEAWLATLLEYRLSKREILQGYLNRVYLGQDGGWQVCGVEAASHLYFGKSAAQLEVGEAALLAGMIAAPHRFEPFDHPRAAWSRRRTVLTAMVGERHLKPEVAEALAALPLPRRPHHLRWDAAAQFTEQALAGNGGRDTVHSSLDIDVQASVFDGCRAGVHELEAKHATLGELARLGDPLQVAVVVMAPDGQVLALQGSRSGAAGEFDRAVSAKRQVGSLVKPFIVATAFENGWTPASELLDEPLEVALGRRVWRPMDDSGTYRGTVTVHDALVSSLNVPMVRLGLQVGLDQVVATLRRAGFAVRSEGPALLLGALEASPLEVAAAYTAMIAGGVRPQARLDSAARSVSISVFRPEVAKRVLAVLEDVPRSGTAASLAGVVDGPLAAKTGTSDARRDSWFVALRPRCVTVVWVGTDGNHETGLYGATGAMEVWRQIDARLPRVWRRGAFTS